MLPLSTITYVKIGVVVLLICGSFFAGWNSRNKDYMDFKTRVEAEGKAQEIHIAEIKKQQELVNKGIENEYNAKLAAIRNYYKSTSVWNNPSSGKVSGLSPTSQLANATAAYTELIGKCAETTQQLVSLQDWINEQMGIK